MKLLIVPVFVCLISFAYAGFFNFGIGRDMDIYVRESNNTRCRWYNSGLLSWIPRRVNDTTYCRCIGIGTYECKTYIPRIKATATANTTADAAVNSTVSAVEISNSTSTNATSAPTALP